jgi:hypothetical protein
MLTSKITTVNYCNCNCGRLTFALRGISDVDTQIYMIAYCFTYELIRAHIMYRCLLIYIYTFYSLFWYLRTSACFKFFKVFGLE